MIQAENDKQTQELPTDCGPLAAMMGFESADSFERKRREVTDRVHEAFRLFYAGREVTSEKEASIKDEVQECLDAFLDDPVCDRLEPIARSD